MGEPIGLRPSRKREPYPPSLPRARMSYYRGSHNMQEITEQEMRRAFRRTEARDYNNSPCWVYMPVSMQFFS